jgi:UDP-N-acetylmuramate: L-alanyl-gamma-D-glutamyl-meso-diaminopimelate ligase
VRPLAPPVETEVRFACRVTGPAGEADLSPGVGGRHNLENAIAVWAALTADGHDPRAVAAALGRCRGVARRLQELGTAGEVTVVDDFAHHPTAVAATLDAVRRGYPGRRLVAALELRSLSAARSLFFAGYLDALSRADRVLLPPLFHASRLPPEERLDLAALAARLGERGVEATIAPGYDELLGTLVATAAPGDVVVSMSSGSFGGLPQRLLAALQARVSSVAKT